MKIFHLLSAVLTGSTLLLSGGTILPEIPNPAPLRQKEKISLTAASGSKKAPEIFLDKTNLTFHLGKRRFIFRKNGSFSCLDARQEILNGYFFVATPFSPWQPSRSAPVQKGYQKTQMNVQEILVDEKARSITWKGVVPFHKKTESTAILRPWQLKVTLTKDNKLDLAFRFETPDNKKFRDSGLFINAPGFIREERSFPDKKKNPRWYQFATCRLLGENPENTLTIQGKSPCYTHPFKKRAFRFSPQDLNWHFVIDPEKITGSVKRLPGGVDFKAMEDLTLPEKTKRNLFLNPYLAQKYHYIWTAGQSFAKGAVNKVSLTDKGALFGKYALKGAGTYYLNTVPVDQGDYVLSFYAKGKGSVYLQLSDERSWYNALDRKSFSFNTHGKWKRLTHSFRFPKQGAVNWIFSARTRENNEIFFDGFQLEKGKKATVFEAPLLTANLESADGLNFFESGQTPELFLEFSTLNTKKVSGTAHVTIRNFFKEEVFRTAIPFSLKDKEYPRKQLPLKKLPDGIYIVQVTYEIKGRKEKHSEFFRFAVMPFLKNQHATAKMYSMTYAGGHGPFRTGCERLLKRYQQIGVGAVGHAGPFTEEALSLYKKYGVIPFDVSCLSRMNSARYKQKFPHLTIPEGRTYFYVRDPWKAHWDKNDAVMPDYRLVGGWTAEYRKKFVESCASILKRCPGLYAYSIGSEWPLEIKNDPHYPDLVEAYAEAVKKVFPNARVYEAGDCNMDLTGGVAQLDSLLPRWEKTKFRPDFLGCHFYTKNLPQLYHNLNAFVKVAEKHGYGKTPLAFPEGMHFYPHEIPQWGRNMVEWMGSGYGGGALSYDLGWGEMLSTAYYVRSYLVFLTIFDRTWCVTSSANYINSVFMDLNLTPRGIQKGVNTLGTLLGSPKKYLGDYTFAPQSRCLVWLDENDAPLAAVWNEAPEMQTGRIKAPLASFPYKEAEFFDMMGSERKALSNGAFPLSAFPLFIRGKTGDTEAFLKALSNAKLLTSNALPFRISTEIRPDDKLGITFSNDLRRTVKGSIHIAGKNHFLTLPGSKEQTLSVQLPSPLIADRINKLDLPYVCNADGLRIGGRITDEIILARRFKGSWEGIPSIPLTNPVMGKGRSFHSEKDFSASFQVAWDEKNLYLRVKVKDDVFAPGNRIGNRYDDDCVQVYFDTRRSAKRFGRTAYDEDDYDYTLMPAMDGKRCEVFRALSPDIQLTLGIAAPKNNEIAKGFKTAFTRTSDGYIYEVAFPAWALLPAKLVKGYNMGFSLFAADRDQGNKVKGGFALTTAPGKSPYMKPHLWPLLLLVE